MKKFMPLIDILPLISSCVSNQDSIAPFAPGGHRVAFGAGFASETLEDEVGDEIEIDEVSIGLSAGQFVTSQLEIGAELGLEDSSTEALGVTAEGDIVTLGGSLRYYTQDHGAARPYIGADLGFLSGSVGDTDRDGVYYGLRAGVMSFITSSTAIDIGLRHVWTDEVWENGAEFDVESNRLSLVASFAVFL